MSVFNLAAFNTACSFLTRFGRGSIVSAHIIAESVFWYPVVGLLLGSLGSFIVWFCSTFLDNYIAPWGIAWVYVLFNIWATRGMHWDGLADLSDALGGDASQSRFWEIIKDSSLGAFGCLSIIVAFSGMLIAVYTSVLQHNYYILILAPFLGRTLCLLFIAIAKPYASNSLSGTVYSGAKFGHLLFWAFIMVSSLLILFSLETIIIFLIACCAVFVYLAKISKNNGGFNGDFLGAIIIITELLALGILS